MEFKEKERINRPGYQRIEYEASSPLNVERILKMIDENQKENNELYYCNTSSFTELGDVQQIEFRSIEELQKVKQFPNPNISFDACYIDKKSKMYAFSFCADTGADNVYYIIDDNMIDVVKRKLQIDKMLKEFREEKKTDGIVK